MRLMYMTGSYQYFAHIHHFRHEMDHDGLELKEKNINKIEMDESSRFKYVPFIRALLESQNENPLNHVVEARQSARVWTMDLQMGLDKRIKELLDAFDEVGP